MDPIPSGGCAYEGRCEDTYRHVEGGAVGAVRTIDFDCSCPVQADRSSVALFGNDSVSVLLHFSHNSMHVSGYVRLLSVLERLYPRLRLLLGADGMNCTRQVVSARCVPVEWLCLQACSGHGRCEDDSICTCDPK